MDGVLVGRALGITLLLSRWGGQRHPGDAALLWMPSWVYSCLLSTIRLL
jgi:hypothetical protein